jgi:hypothetical protein
MATKRVTTGKKVTAPKRARAAATAATVTQEAIARRAYEIFVSRGCADGCDVEDWLTAERELQRG